MIRETQCGEGLAAVRNPVLRAQVERYEDIYADFMEQVRATGIEVGEQDGEEERSERCARLSQMGVALRNDARSLVHGWLSPACEACQKGIGSATFFISLKCHRTCFYCFNPNQENYAAFSKDTRALAAELDHMYRSGQSVKHLALTGGEPLLYKTEAVEFFRHGRLRFPQAYQRLYTSGDHLDAGVLRALRDAGLDEIRISIRMHDLARGQRHTFDRLALAREYLPRVMVEMPVLPGTLALMQPVLLELDRLQVDGINLLEFCYPFANAEAYRERGYRVKARPYRVLYDYWYAGGLPVAGSEIVCLDLLAFAVSAGLRLGVHYCSLENKHSGQIYQQDYRQRPPATYCFSPRDYFFKTVRAYGKDVAAVRDILRGCGYTGYRLDHAQRSIEFHVNQIAALREQDLELGLSYNVFEARADGQYLREVTVEPIRSSTFDLERDL